jgi:hypothetical protein
MMMLVIVVMMLILMMYDFHFNQVTEDSPCPFIEGWILRIILSALGNEREDSSNAEEYLVTY